MYAEHSAVMIMILSRLFYERFSVLVLGSVVFDFVWKEFRVFYFCICLFLMNFPLAYESHINICYAEYSLCVPTPGIHLDGKSYRIGL